MGLRNLSVRLLTRLDKCSPRPVLYPFVMSDDEKKLFTESIRHSRGFLEFGLGGSTLRTLQKSKARIFSVESSDDWIEYMRGYRPIRSSENKRLVIHHVDIGPTREWGRPVSDEQRHLFPAYSSSIFDVIDSAEIDTAIVDGRFRVACTLKIILECHTNPDFRILIHDFWNREKYHLVLKYLDVVDRVDTLALFAIKPGNDLDEIAREYENFQFNPD